MFITILEYKKRCIPEEGSQELMYIYSASVEIVVEFADLFLHPDYQVRVSFIGSHTWRIIPFSKCLITRVSKSPKYVTGHYL